MIISDQHKLAFVHIPKCAGSSVKAANPTIQNTFNRNFEDHDVLGPVDLSHLPLWAFREHFPDVFDKILNYQSFAVTRDPIERFGSSVMQRCRQYLNYEAADITPDVMVHVAKEAIVFLKENPDSLVPEFIHFKPQSHFIRLDGKTIVKHVDLPGQFSQLNNFLKSQDLAPVSTSDRQNASVEPANATLKTLSQTLRPIYRTLLPKKLKDVLWLKLIDAGIYAPEANRYAPLAEDAEITAFINDFYAEDFDIFQKAKADEARLHASPTG